jgi:hypothetical protein
MLDARRGARPRCLGLGQPARRGLCSCREGWAGLLRVVLQRASSVHALPQLSGQALHSC